MKNRARRKSRRKKRHATCSLSSASWRQHQSSGPAMGSRGRPFAQTPVLHQLGMPEVRDSICESSALTSVKDPEHHQPSAIITVLKIYNNKLREAPAVSFGDTRPAQLSLVRG